MARSRSRKPVAPMMFPSQLARQGAVPQSGAGKAPAFDAMEISVCRREGSAEPRVFVFQQARVTVGRASTCDLRLEDPKRLASGFHAEFALTGDGVRVIDLESRNATFLNGVRLEPRTEHEVCPGDEIVISDIELQVQGVALSPSVPDDRTILAEGSLNPFLEDVQALAEVLERVAVTFEDEAPESRLAALEQAMAAALGDNPVEAHHEIGRILSRSEERPNRRSE